MSIITFQLGDLITNTYLIIDDLTQECVVIDPADDAQFISDEILRQNLTLTKIIATHGHFDHNLASAELQLNFDILYLIHQADEFLINDLANRASYWLKKKIELNSPVITDYLIEGQVIKIGTTQLKVMHTPGHTPGGCCLILEDEQTIITGDTLFADNIPGRTDLRYSSSEKMKQSLVKIQQKFSGFRGLSGHGEEFIV